MSEKDKTEEEYSAADAFRDEQDARHQAEYEKTKAKIQMRHWRLIGVTLGGAGLALWISSALILSLSGPAYEVPVSPEPCHDHILKTAATFMDPTCDRPEHLLTFEKMGEETKAVCRCPREKP